MENISTFYSFKRHDLRAYYRDLTPASVTAWGICLHVQGCVCEGEGVGIWGAEGSIKDDFTAVVTYE